MPPGRLRTSAVWAIGTLGLVLAALASSRQAPRVYGTVWFCFDVSRSMLVTNAAGNRLERAKGLAASLLEHSPDQTIGLVAFAGNARIVCPPTRDHAHLRRSIAELSIDSAPAGGSAIDTVFTVLRETGEGPENDPRSGLVGLVCLVSDGGEGPPDIDRLVPTPDRDRWTVLAIGIGDPDTASPIPLPDGAGPLIERGRQVESRLNEAPLRALASATGGRYVRAQADRDAGNGLADAATDILARPVHAAPFARFQLFTLAALLLALGGTARRG